MTTLLVLRPEPGASRTLVAASALGLDAIAMPLFTIEAVGWSSPTGNFDALMLTSANAVRLAGVGLGAIGYLPVYAVGEATAAAAREAGLIVAHVGDGDAMTLIEAMGDAGVRHILHLAGEAHLVVEETAVTIERAIVYRSVPVNRLPISPAAGSVALIHSPAAGSLFARLIGEAGLSRDGIAIAAISAAAASATGAGWSAIAVAPRPTDAALLAVAAKLCEEGASDAHGQR